MVGFKKCCIELSPTGHLEGIFQPRGLPSGKAQDQDALILEFTVSQVNERYAPGLL